MLKEAIEYIRNPLPIWKDIPVTFRGKEMPARWGCSPGHPDAVRLDMGRQPDGSNRIWLFGRDLLKDFFEQTDYSRGSGVGDVQFKQTTADESVDMELFELGRYLTTLTVPAARLEKFWEATVENIHPANEARRTLAYGPVVSALIRRIFEEQGEWPAEPYSIPKQG